MLRAALQPCHDTAVPACVLGFSLKPRTQAGRVPGQPQRSTGINFQVAQLRWPGPNAALASPRSLALSTGVGGVTDLYAVHTQSWHLPSASRNPSLPTP